MLAKRPENRYQTPAAAAKALERVAKEHDSSADPGKSALIRMPSHPSGDPGKSALIRPASHPGAAGGASGGR